MVFRVTFFFFCAVGVIWANLRAPVRIDRGGSGLKAEKAALTVLGESLEFQCPESYTGKMDFELFAARACDTRVRYKITADKPERVKLTFVFSGSGHVTYRYRDKMFTAVPRSLKIDGHKICSFCPDSMKNMQIAEQVIEFETGEAELEITYRQALNYDESGHGYFSNGTWTQGFTYELWPIAEWQWAENLALELKFSITARSGFLGIGYKNDIMSCSIGENAAQQEIPLAQAKVQADRRVAGARVALRKRPQRLHCHYGAE